MHFAWPLKNGQAKSVGETLLSEIASAGWRDAEAWAKKANKIAPTIVGGSKKHGGPDLGPTRAKRARPFGILQLRPTRAWKSRKAIRWFFQPA